MHLKLYMTHDLGRLYNTDLYLFILIIFKQDCLGAAVFECCTCCVRTDMYVS